MRFRRSKREEKKENPEERKIKEEDVPELIGPENLKELMKDLQVIDKPGIKLENYHKETLEQAKKDGSREYSRWLLHLATREVFKRQMDVIVEHLIKKYGIDLKGHESENKYTILSYISNQLRQKTRAKLFELGKNKLITEYNNLA